MFRVFKQRFGMLAVCALCTLSASGAFAQENEGYSGTIEYVPVNSIDESNLPPGVAVIHMRTVTRTPPTVVKRQKPRPKKAKNKKPNAAALTSASGSSTDGSSH